MAKEEKANVVKIEKYIIAVAGHKIELTPAQAEELHNILAKALGKDGDFQKLLEELAKPKKEKEYIPVPTPYPVPEPWPVYPKKYPYWEPIWITTTTPRTGDFICGQSSGTLQLTCKV